MVIRHSIEAMSANGQFNITSKSLQKSTQKLSSGYRINSAADDAAGLSISEKMRKQIRGLTRASANAEDGISLVQIADGALEEVQSMLQRMNELCVQAANGTNSDTDRTYIQDEVTELTTEIDRIAATTKFNEINLLDGSIEKPGRTEESIESNNERIEEVVRSYDDYNYSNPKTKTANTYTVLNGERAGQVVTQEDIDNTSGLKIIYMGVDEVKTTPEASTSTTTGNASSHIYNYDSKYDKLKSVLENEIVPSAVQAIINAYPSAFGYLNDSVIGIGLLLGDNSNVGNNVLAYVQLESYYNKYSNIMQNKLGYQLAINIDSITLDVNNNINDASRNKLEVTIVHEMMHAFMDESLTSGMTGIVGNVYDPYSSDKYPKWFIEGMAQTAAGGYYNGNDFVNSGLGIVSTMDENTIKQILDTNPLSSVNNDNSNYGTGYLACMYLGYLVGGGSTNNVAINASNASKIQTGLSKILVSLMKGSSLEDVIKDNTKYNSLNDFYNNFSNDAKGFVKALTDYVGNTGTGGIVGNLTTQDDILANTNAYKDVALFKLSTSDTNFINVYPYDYTVYSGGTATKKGTPVDGSDKWNTGSGTGGISDSSGSSGTSKAAFKRAHGNGLAIHAGADSDIKNKIFIYIDAMDSESLGISDVDVSTVDAATISIERVALALTQVSTQRSELGAYQNRLEHTIKNLDNVVENTTASESLIRDTDMATELVKYSNANIIAQAGQAMLAQANQSKEGILALVG